MKKILVSIELAFILILKSNIGYSQVKQQQEVSNQTSQQELSEEYTEAKFQGEEEIEYKAPKNGVGMIKTENGWEAINSKNITTTTSNKTVINRKQFVGNYSVKMNIDGMNTTFYVNVKIVKGKLEFIVNEGGSINAYYEEASVKEIQKNIQYDFKADDLDSGSSRTYHFKKKGNRFELKFNY